MFFFEIGGGDGLGDFPPVWGFFPAGGFEEVDDVDDKTVDVDDETDFVFFFGGEESSSSFTICVFDFFVIVGLTNVGQIFDHHLCSIF